MFYGEILDNLTILKCIKNLAQLENGKVQEENVSLDEFLKRDMSLRLITSIHLPQRKGYHFRALKVPYVPL